MNNTTALILGLFGLLGSIHLIRTASAALGIPPQFIVAAVRLVL
jgi:hypothetical protein